MTSISLDISGKISPDIVAIYRDVWLVANSLGAPFLVVGAAARDLVLHYGYGARITRALTANLFEHRKIVFVTDSKNACYDLSVALLRQNAAEKTPALVLGEWLLPQRQ